MTDDRTTARGASLKATLIGGAAARANSAGLASISATIPGLNQPLPTVLDWSGTHDTVAEADSSGRSERAEFSTQAGRFTVLPRRDKGEQLRKLETGARPRFDRVRLLGKGGMGEVELARDNDIRRTVAVKRLTREFTSEEALLRFADEIRVVGQLEHPGIVPVYDVGQDDAGQVYLVMKHLQGETMEDVIAKLHSGDADYQKRFSLEYRVHLFLEVLDAVRYAHARGILHRDIKPANVQIGPFGEVTVMDWGIAKPIRSPGGAGGVEPLARTLLESHDQRLLQTQVGSLAGTPLYMSPEQAAGHNDDLDQRSDVYSLCVLFYEWLVLEHPLRDKLTVSEVLAALISQGYPVRALVEPAIAANVPMEYVWLVVRGLNRDRDHRFQSVSEFEDAIKRVLDGNIRVQCHITLGKRVASGLSTWIDRNAVAYTVLLACCGIGLLGAIVVGLLHVARALR